MNTQNTFHEAVSVTDGQATFGDPVPLKTNTMMSLIEVVQESLNLVSGIDSSLLTVTPTNDVQLVRYNRCVVGILVYPLDGQGNECEDTPLPMAYASGADWHRALKEIAARHPECQAVIDSMPPCIKDLDKVGVSHVIVPDSDNMTEEMIDASRSLLLYTDTHGEHGIPMVRARIGSSPWFKRVAPKWFAEGKDHLTKAGRAILAYDLTLKAHTHPQSEEERKWGKRMPAYVPRVRYGYKITFNAGQNKELVISRAFGTRFKPEKHGDVIDIQINRHQLPDAWKPFFKSSAISFKGTVVIGEDGIATASGCELVTNLREKAASVLSWQIDPSVVIPE